MLLAMSSPLSVLALSLPAILCAGLLLAGAELLWARRHGARTHDAAQLSSDLACALVRLPAEVAVNLLFVMTYQFIQRRAALPVMPLDSPWTWLCSFLGFEFAFYWTHRLSHKIPLLWAVHAVHHQSNDFNLIAGMRLGAFAPILNYPFFLSLTLIGVPIEGFIAALYVSGSWQFLLHTQLFKGPRALRWLLNTPLHHRLHHSTRRELTERNYASVLICIDRLFGTYAEQEIPLRFGVVPPLPPCNPVEANLQPWRQLARKLASLGDASVHSLAIFALSGSTQKMHAGSPRQEARDVRRSGA